MLDSINPFDSIQINRDRTPMAVARAREQGPQKFQTVLDETITREVHSHGKKPVDKKLMNVCVEMESIFVAKMLKEMRKTVPKGEFLHGGFAEEIFEDMLYDEYALDLSKSSNLGLAKMLYDELSRK